MLFARLNPFDRPLRVFARLLAAAILLLEAFAISRLESAVTLQRCAKTKPGISRLTACNPNPTIPKRTIENLAS